MAESTVSERRRERVRQALANRLGSIVVVAEAIWRRHNLSAILRSAEAFGLHEAHLVSGGAFRPSRNAARGAERWLELHGHEDVGACARALADRGFELWIADPVPGALSPDDVPVDRPLAVLFGAELAGVSDAARALAVGAIAVPMRGLTESLNVSAAASCILHRLTERRRAWVGGGDLSPERQEAFFRAWLDGEAEAEIGMRARTEG